MKTLLCVALLSLFSLSLSAQKLPKEIDQKYDKFRDETTVSMAMTLGLAHLDISFTHLGKSITSNPTEFRFLFIDNCRSYFCFSAEPEIRFLVNDQRVNISNIPISNGIRSDSAMIVITRAELQQFGVAKSLEVQIDRQEYKWSTKQITLLKTFLDFATVK